MSKWSLTRPDQVSVREAKSARQGSRFQKRRYPERDNLASSNLVFEYRLGETGAASADRLAIQDDEKIDPAEQAKNLEAFFNAPIKMTTRERIF